MEALGYIFIVVDCQIQQREDSTHVLTQPACIPLPYRTARKLRPQSVRDNITYDRNIRVLG
jgi:hypothetical protein